MVSRNNGKKSDQHVTRRDFLKGGGAVIASAVLFNSLFSCATSETTKSTTTATTSTPGTTTATTSTPGTTTTTSTSATTSALTPKYGGTVRLTGGGSTTPFGWPAETRFTTYAQYSLETLLRGDSKVGLKPWLAESYKVADDLKSIAFTLRKGIKFSDGSDFNAAVAKWNLDNMIDAKREPTWKSVDIIDDYNIRVNLNMWSCIGPLSFAEGNTMAFMVSKAAFDKNGIDWMRWNTVGTGPFIQTKYQMEVSTNFVKNPDYWVKGRPYLDGVDSTYFADYTSTKMVMETGGLDMVNIQPQDAAHFKDKGWNIKYIPEDSMVLIPDTANADSPYANQKVREAVEYAIDKEAIAKAFGFGYRQAPYQIPPRASSAYDPNFTGARKYDLNKAKQLLAEAGYANGFDTQIIQFPNPAIKDITISLQASLAAVGIRAEVKFPTSGEFNASYMGPKGAWPKGTMIFNAQPRFDQDFLGALQFMDGIVGTSWLRTPEWKQAYNAAISAPAVDVKLIRAVTDIMSKDASFIPVNELGGFFTLKPNLHLEIGQRAFGTFVNYEEVWLDK
jgi:peptide/nickel transport system substrate-binding protein